MSFRLERSEVKWRNLTTYTHGFVGDSRLPAFSLLLLSADEQEKKELFQVTMMQGRGESGEFFVVHLFEDFA
jgi:hypothetical protein